MESSFVKLNKDSWHSKLLKWAFDTEPNDIKNFCPYFWLVITAIIASPFIAIWKSFLTIVRYTFGYDEVNRDKIIEKFVQNATLEQMALIAVGSDHFSTFENAFKGTYIPKVVITMPWTTVRKYINYKGYDLTDVENILVRYFNEHKDEIFEHLVENNCFSYKQDANEFAMAVFDKEIPNRNNYKKKRDNAIKVAKATKNGVCLIGYAVIAFMLYFLSCIGTGLVTIIIHSFFTNPVESINVTFLILGIILSIILLSLWISYSGESVSGIYEHITNGGKVNELGLTFFQWIILFIPLLLYTFVYGFLYKGILLNIIGLFVNNGSIFGTYVKSAYSDFCPGIEWNEEEEDKNKEENKED